MVGKPRCRKEIGGRQYPGYELVLSARQHACHGGPRWLALGPALGFRDPWLLSVDSCDAILRGGFVGQLVPLAVGPDGFKCPPVISCEV